MPEDQQCSAMGVTRMRAVPGPTVTNVIVESLFPDITHYDLEIQLLDRQRGVLSGHSISMLHLHGIEVTNLCVNPHDDRIRDVLNRGTLFRGTAVIEIPTAAWKATSYLELKLRRIDPVHEGPHSNPRATWNHLTLEVPKRGLARGRAIQPRVHWLLDEEQREVRLEAIIERYDRLRRTDVATVEALAQLFFLIRAGTDCPLLTTPLDVILSKAPCPKLDAFVNGLIKNAGLRLRRERHTRFGLVGGKHRVAELLAEEIPKPDRQSTKPGPEQRRWELRIALGHLYDFTNDPRYRALLRRRLLRGECIETVAGELGLNYATARHKVMEVYEYFGLRG